MKIGESDFVEDRTPGDAPRVVRIELTFRSSSPDKSWTMAHALADLMVTSERGRRVRRLEQEAAGAEAALGSSGRAAGERAAATPTPTPAVSGTPRDGLELRDSAQTWLARRSLAANEGLRFELTDPGQRPTDQFRNPWAMIIATLLGLPFLLFAAALLAGACDPRVLDEADLTAMGVVVLGTWGRATQSTARV